MTGEERNFAIEILKHPQSADDSDIKHAIYFAIQALEQDSILDKIMEEINSPNRGTCDYFIVDRIEEIIKKHREVDV